MSTGTEPSLLVHGGRGKAVDSGVSLQLPATASEAGQEHSIVFITGSPNFLIGVRGQEGNKHHTATCLRIQWRFRIQWQELGGSLKE